MSRERPILFSGDMVRAILDGRKTQTRRVVKPTPPDWIDRFGVSTFTPEGHLSGRGYWRGVPGDEGPAEKHFRCPYGKPGDRLWVRESFAVPVASWTDYGWEWDGDDGRRLGGERPKSNQFIKYGLAYKADSFDEELFSPWRPSIFMPRWASRITLEVTGVRVERLQDITSAGAIAEGILPYANSQTIDCDTPDPRDDFAGLWDRINAKRGHPWDTNPWVWSVSFRKVEP